MCTVQNSCLRWFLVESGTLCVLISSATGLHASFVLVMTFGTLIFGPTQKGGSFMQLCAARYAQHPTASSDRPFLHFVCSIRLRFLSLRHQHRKSRNRCLLDLKPPLVLGHEEKAALLGQRLTTVTASSKAHTEAF